MKSNQRNPIFAFFLALFSVGVGQFYNGQYKKAIIFFIISVMYYPVVALTNLQFSFYGLLIIFGVNFIFYVFTIIDSVIVAKRTKDHVAKYNWYVYVLIVFVTFFIPSFDSSLSISYVQMEGVSMSPTIEHGDRLVVNTKDNLGVQNGDVVLLNDMSIKRIVGNSGDIIRAEDGTIYINDEKLDEPYVDAKVEEDFGPIEIGDNKIFVLGDNRLNSKDSRYYGTIPRENVVGKAAFIYWPTTKKGIN